MLDIHATAVVDPKAEIDDDVTIGPYAVIGPQVRIGAGTHIGPHAVIDGFTRLGMNNRVHAGAVLGGPPQDLKYRGEKTFLVIGNDNTIRECVTMNLACIEGESTVVGNHCLFMAYSHVAHNCSVGDHAIMANCVSLAGHVEIARRAIVGGNAAVHQFVRVGTHVIVGGGSIVLKDVVPFVKANGNPLKLAGLNVIGLERNGFGPERRARLKLAYRILFRSNLNITQAVARIRDEFGPEDDDIRVLLDFIDNSERGINT